MTTPSTPTPEEIEAAKSPAGGWTKAQLAAWGVSWPPPRGWRKLLIARSAYRLSDRLADERSAAPPKALPMPPYKFQEPGPPGDHVAKYQAEVERVNRTTDREIDDAVGALTLTRLEEKSVQTLITTVKAQAHRIKVLEDGIKDARALLSYRANKGQSKAVREGNANAAWHILGALTDSTALLGSTEGRDDG